MLKKSILLVEDNPDDEALTIRALQKNNIPNKVIVAHDGVEALELLFADTVFAERGDSNLPQLVLLDLKLPKLSGIDVLRKIRADGRTHKLPVVALTSSIEEKDIEETYTLGVNSYIRKPIDFEGFVDAVDQIGRYWLELNQNPYHIKHA